MTISPVHRCFSGSVNSFCFVQNGPVVIWVTCIGLRGSSKSSWRSAMAIPSNENCTMLEEGELLWKILSRGWDMTKWKFLQITLHARTKFVINGVKNYKLHYLTFHFQVQHGKQIMIICVSFENEKYNLICFFLFKHYRGKPGKSNESV